MRPSVRSILLLLPYAALVLWVTLGPVPWASDANESPDGVLDWRLWVDPSTWSVGSEREFALNVLLFVPLGALLGWAMRGLPAIAPLLLAFGLTVTIELLQIPLPDRISDPRDLLANAAGAIVGVVIARAADGARRLAARVTRRSAGPQPTGRPSPPPPAPAPPTSPTGPSSTRRRTEAPVRR